MALFHQSVKVISRGKGQSGVASLAYRSGTALLDDRTGKLEDYTKKSVESVEFSLPEKVPAFFKDWARDVANDKQGVMQKFSDYVESFERRNDSQIYREVEFALQREFSDEVNKQLAREFTEENFSSAGMVVLRNFHKDIDKKTGKEKFHCHTLLTTRHIDENGFGLKNRSWNDKELQKTWREKWADKVNEKFVELGIDKRIDHRSLEAQGLVIKPLPKQGMALVAMAKRGLNSIYLKLFEDTKRGNLYQIQKRPELALEYISKGQSTFVRDEVIQLVGRYADSHEVFSNLVERIMASREIVHLEGEGRDAVYTTRSQLKIEHDLVERSETLTSKASHEVKDDFVDSALRHFNEKLSQYNGLSQDQEMAIRHMTGAGQLKAIVGYAGSGKSTAIEAAQMAWEMQGYRVVGLAPTNAAKNNLIKSGITSYTIDNFNHGIEAGRLRYKKDTVFVMDEAGMVDSRRMHGVVKKVEALGAKLVLVGDGEQLQSIQSGPALRMLLDKLGPEKIESIIRQKETWQKAATVLFGQGETREALELYRQNGCMKLVKEELPSFGPGISDDKLVQLGSTAKRMAGSLWHKIKEDLLSQGITSDQVRSASAKHPDYGLFKEWQSRRDEALGEMEKRGLQLDRHSVDHRRQTKLEMVKDWARDRENNPEFSHIMLANSNSDVRDLNNLARDILRDRGLISKQETLLTVEVEEDLGLGRKRTKDTKVGFSVGDQVIFKANENGLRISKGDIGVIQQIKGKKVEVMLLGADKRVVSFSNNLYRGLSHGWATTITSSQGSTYDSVKTLASFECYKNLVYVASTRHRTDYRIYGSSLEFHTAKMLIDRLSSRREKLATTDYVQTSEQVEKLVWEEKRIFDKAEKAYLRLKEGSQAASHYVKGLFKVGDEQIKVEAYGFKSEAERAIDKLGHSSIGMTTDTISSDIKRDGPESIPRSLLVAAGNKQLEPLGTPLLASQSALSSKPREKQPELYDLDRIKNTLKTDGERLVSKLLGMAPNSSLSTAQELRYGTKGSFAFNTRGPQAGKWRDFEAGEGGDLFKLVGRELKLNEFKSQLDYVARFYGFLPEQSLSMETYSPKEQGTADAESLLRQQEGQAKNLEKIAHINKTWTISKPIAGTLAETYLRDHRKIEGPLPESLRFIGYHGKEKLPALAAFVTDRDGNRTGMQLTYLDAKTAKKAAIAVNKRSHGFIGGSAVVVKKGAGTIFVAEGVETALSLASVVPKDATVLAILGVSNFANLKVEKSQSVVLCADNDGDKQSVVKALNKAVERINEQGAQVVVIKPDKAGYDYNDVLKEEGSGGVLTYVQKALNELKTIFSQKEPKSGPANNSIALTNKLQEKLLDEFAGSYKAQHKKEATQAVLNSCSEQVRLAASYLTRNHKDPLSDELSRYRAAAMVRAKHELAAGPERTQDFFKQLKTGAARSEEGKVQSLVQGERLAVIEGRLIEQDVLNGGSGQRRWEISNPARQELKSNDELYDKLKDSYQLEGMSKSQAQQLASLHISYKEAFGKEPDVGVVYNLKELSSYLCERKTQLMGKDLGQGGNREMMAEQVLLREKSALLMAGDLNTLSPSQLQDIQDRAISEANKKAQQLERSISRGASFTR